MSREKAREHFLGKNGRKKVNCGQAVLQAFADKLPVPADTRERFESYGGGGAPEGHCGSYYAAKVLLEKSQPEKFKECEQAFLSLAGSTKCKEIRALKKLSCVGCVEKAAEIIEKE